MKDIKFRAWFIGTKSMQDWAGISHRFSHETGYWYFNNPKIILMQYTGLKDKNDVEIYEGDIIKYDFIGIIKYGFYTVHDMNDCGEQDVYGYYIKAKHSRTDGTTYILNQNMEYYKYMEVIGNIYEDPELLEEKESNE